MQKKPLILIVDDEPFNVDYLQYEVTYLGYEAMSATNGRSALNLLNTLAPDLILLDILMPEMDGFEFISHLKQHEQWRNIPVIIISALDDITNIVKGIEMGAEDYLSKPINPILLKARMTTCLEKKALLDQRQKYLAQIEQEKTRADELLHVLFPQPIAKELKETNQVIPRLYENVAILFIDVVGFAKYCQEHQPEKVIANLQKLFIAYEELVIKHKLQKIKTVGDAFMAVGGLLNPMENPVLSCVQCGLDMLQATQKQTDWEVKIGIHIGTVIAGVIGHYQYLFDVWGQPVSLAQKIESHGAIGKINLSHVANEALENKVSTELLGTKNFMEHGKQAIFIVKEVIR